MTKAAATLAALVAASFVGIAGPAAARHSHGPRRLEPELCFQRAGWILEENSPAGGLAYPRGGGEHFQEWVAWWNVGRPAPLKWWRVKPANLAATDSGLLTPAENALALRCVGREAGLP